MNKDIMPDTWSAVDGLGRFLPENDITGNPKERFVGMFYWTWHELYEDSQNAVNIAWQSQGRGRGTVNVQKLMDESPEAKNDYNHPGWRNICRENSLGSAHWDEPVYGYYYSTDHWVLRRQAVLLASAGVDTVIFDNTNGMDTWEKGYMAVGEVFSKAKKDGINVPGISFLLPLHYPYNENNPELNRIQLRDLYQKVYSKGLFKDVWFYWKGKPLIMAYPDALDPNDPIEKEILEFFTFRPCQPSYYRGQVLDNMWGWLSVYPQKVYNNPDGTPEQITVGVAQNTNAEMQAKKKTSCMNGEGIYGRSYTSKGFDTRPDSAKYGANFQEQWDRALAVDPEFVFVTGWNEWISAPRPVRCGVPCGLSDEFDAEHSRDIEPSKGMLKDHYYYQLCSNIRKFKGTNAVQTASPTSLNLNSDSKEWEKSGYTYSDYKKDLTPRDARGYYHYKNNTGRNAIALSRVSHDSENIYFDAVCENDLTDKHDELWMRLLIRTMQDAPTWEGFHYIVNRFSPGEKAFLEKSLGSWKWTPAAECDYIIDKNRIVIAIPRKLLGAEYPNFKVWFKWCDNNLNDGDIMTVYTDGDASPCGRFTFSYIGSDEV